jgi:protein-disulfide isomerase
VSFAKDKKRAKYFHSTLDKSPPAWQNPIRTQMGCKGNHKSQECCMSKRQQMREKRKQQELRNRIIAIVLVTLGALGVAFLFIYPSLKPVGDIVTVTPRSNLPNPQGHALGNPEAKVTIEVWEDFQCPSCKNYSNDIEPQVIENLVATGKAYYVYRFYPFIGAESQQAANAAMCAADQGRFWDYQAILIANWQGENQNYFSDRRLQAFAQSIGLDMTKFNSCFSANTFKSEINADFSKGQQVGVNGTPSLFVNGQAVSPGYIPTYDQIVQAVDAALAGTK